MSENTTVIPSTSNTDDVYVTKNTSDQITLGSQYFLSDAQQNIELIELQANATVTPIDHDTYVVDTFSDSTGYLNTVNTGSTTSTFSTDKYVNGLGLTNVYDVISGTNGSGDIYFYNGTSGTTSSASSGSAGSWRWTSGTNFYIEQDQTQVSSTSDFFLKTESSSPMRIIRTAGADGTYNVTLDVYHLLSGGDGCRIHFIIDDAIQSTVNPTAQSWTNCTADLTVTSGQTYGVLIDWDAGASYDQFAVKDFIFEKEPTSASLVYIDLPTISGTVTHTELVLNSPLGEANIDYSLVDTGANEDANLALETKNILTNVDGSLLSGGVLKINLTDVSQVKSYVLKLWKS